MLLFWERVWHRTQRPTLLGRWCHPNSHRPCSEWMRKVDDANWDNGLTSWIETGPSHARPCESDPPIVRA